MTGPFPGGRFSKERYFLDHRTYACQRLLRKRRCALLWRHPSADRRRDLLPPDHRSSERTGTDPADLTAILITHTHSDHISGLNTLLKKTACPLLATPRTCWELSCRVEGIDPRLMGLDSPITLGEIDMQPIPTSHDAPGSCGWRLDTESGSVGFLTDTGYVTDEALDLLPGVDFVILEANHDVESLCSGPYPYYLKQRILGLQGHLCNEDAAQFAVTLAENGASDIVLAHLSRDNNTPAMALNAVAAALDGAGLTPELSVAPRDTVGPCHIVRRRALCKR